MKIIKLTQGKGAIVDDDCYERLSKYNWQYTYYGYASRGAFKEELASGSPSNILMHRELMNAPNGVDVDHINGDRLDNRLENLRLCSRKENLRNTMKRMNTKKGVASSKYKGIYWAKDRNKWRATIRFNGKNYHIGTFEDELEAAKAYNEYAEKHFGDFARINEI